MRIKSILLFHLLLLVGCSSTPMERAKITCTELGDPSSYCLERRLNVEEAREEQRNRNLDSFVRQQYGVGGSMNSMGGSSFSNSYPPPGVGYDYPGMGATPTATESEYDRKLRQLGQNCITGGGRLVKGGGCVYD
jgi:hypothetical protein